MYDVVGGRGWTFSQSVNVMGTDFEFCKNMTSHSDLFSCLHTCSKKIIFVVFKLQTEIQTKLTKILTL